MDMSLRPSEVEQKATQVPALAKRVANMPRLPAGAQTRMRFRIPRRFVHAVLNLDSWRLYSAHGQFSYVSLAMVGGTLT